MIQINKWPHMIIVLLLISLALSLVACDPDDDDDADVIIPQEVHNEKLNGVWAGEYGPENTNIIFMMKDGDTYATSAKGCIFSGPYTYTTPNGVFTCTLECSTGTIEVNGTASEQGKIEGTYTHSDGQTGNIAMQFDGNYNGASSFELVAGQWASDNSSYVIDNDGRLTGTFLGDCDITGTLSIIDANFNLYILDADLTGCEHEGQFHGLAHLWDRDDVENSAFMAIAATNPIDIGISIVGDRQ